MAMAEINHMLYRCFDLARRRQTAAHEHAACTRRWAAKAGPRASPVFQLQRSGRRADMSTRGAFRQEPGRQVLAGCVLLAGG